MKGSGGIRTTERTSFRVIVVNPGCCVSGLFREDGRTAAAQAAKQQGVHAREEDDGEGIAEIVAAAAEL